MRDSQVVVFDLGNVLLQFDYGIAVRKFLLHCHMDETGLQRLVNQSPLLHQFESDAISADAFYSELRTAAGFRGTFREFAEIFCDIFTPVQAMIEAHSTLTAAGVLTYIFSNTNKLQSRHIRERYPFFAKFHGYILSCDHGAMKPDPRLYQIVESFTGRTGGELVYIDDRAENIQTGRERGWRTIHHQQPEETIRQLRALGLPV